LLGFVYLVPSSVGCPVAQVGNPAHGSRATIARSRLFFSPAVDPNHPVALLRHANLLLGVGRLKAGLIEAQRSLSLEPFDPTAIFNGAVHNWLNGQNDAAIALLGALPANFFEHAPYLAASMRRQAATAKPPTP